MFYELLLIFFLMVLNGIFVMAEIALVSSRKARLETMAKHGNKRAKLALKFTDMPDYFLSTIQIFITLIGIIAATYGGTNIADKLADYYRKFPVLFPYAHFLGVATIVTFITYLSLVIGELVPKTLGINKPEKVATAFAPFIQFLGWLAAPVRWFLQVSTHLILKILMVKTNTEPVVTAEELHHIIEQGSQYGILEKQETKMMRGIFKIGDRRVSSLMTHRSEVVWVDIHAKEEEVLETIHASIHSSFPVCDGGLDKIIGTVTIKDLFIRVAEKTNFDLKELLTTPLFVPETMTALELLETFKKNRNHTGLIVNEYGALEGIVTLHDLMESIVGDIPLTSEEEEKTAIQRKDGSWLIDGIMHNDEWSELLHLTDLTDTETGSYKTLGGFVMQQLGKIPKATDHFTFRSYYFEVMDMDGKRVDKVLIKKVSSTGEDHSSESL